MKNIVTFGEILLRLTTPGFKTIKQSQSFDGVFGGGEANVAMALAQYGFNVNFVTKVPKHALGRSAMQFLNYFGVNTDHVVYDEQRLGVYFLEKGYSIRPTRVIYDREQSSFACSKINDYDFDIIFENVDWFHLGGITPALSEELFEISLVALEIAQKKGVKTSCDLNYRKSLWSFKSARAKMSILMKNIDVCFGIEPLELPTYDDQDYKDRCEKPFSEEEIKKIMSQLKEMYQFTQIVHTFRTEKSVNQNEISAIVMDDQGFFKSKTVDVQIVDRVGTGDAFAAGMIYGLLQFDSMQKTIDFATASFALKHTIEGDANILDLSDILHFMNADHPLSIIR
ncbi:sugar kinase [Amphibacillus jilinensis]|uniref:sugar kinase n=1 Tax=Amphibacillus jilinensis TaxID=1216008 RepID=UPI00032011AE|nr:sugar kinase [Amphibacillus jilinensis]